MKECTDVFLSTYVLGTVLISGAIGAVLATAISSIKREWNRARKETSVAYQSRGRVIVRRIHNGHSRYSIIKESE